METLEELWSLAPWWGPLFVLAVAAYAFVRYVRSRASSEPAPAPGPPPSAGDAANLDSSHIGWASLGGDAEDDFHRNAGGSAPGRGAGTGHE